MSLSLAGKTAIVTGAAHGIGNAVARHFVDRGAKVMFADEDEDRLAQDLGAEARRDGSPVRYFGCDISQKLSMANLLSATYDAFDRVDVLVNAARVFGTCDPLATDIAAFEEMLQRNVVAGLRLSQMTAKRMIAQAKAEGRRPADGEIGAIVNLSSIAAQRAQPELLSFSIACAAQDQATRSLALALAPHGIRVNAVAFGSVMSASLQALLREQPALREAITEATPMGRIAPAQDMVEAVQFLASDGAAFITGQILTVDGGRSVMDAVRVPAF